MDDREELERRARIPEPVDRDYFNPETELPHGLTTEHLYRAMHDFAEFIGFLNGQLATKDIERLETMLMPASFSSMVGEYMNSTIPKYCAGLAKNQYHNGHPDLIPTGMFPGNAVQHAHEGIEIKGSRYLTGWQGHNREASWLMVFCFDSNRPLDVLYPLSAEEEKALGETERKRKKGAKKAQRPEPPRPFRFLLVAGAQLEVEDWSEAARKQQTDAEGTLLVDAEGNPIFGRRTATAGVLTRGREKMVANWIYRVPELVPAPKSERSSTRTRGKRAKAAPSVEQIELLATASQAEDGEI